MDNPAQPDLSDLPAAILETAAMPHLGALIRQERQKRQMTLVQVCERAKISPAFLSLVERGKATPSLGSLAGIADALGLSVSNFLNGGAAADAITRAGDRPRFSIAGSSLEYERMSTVFPGQQIDAVTIHVPPGYSSETIAHVGEEWIYVITGEFQQTIGGRTIRLGPGDTCHFRGDNPHSYANRGREPAVVIWIGTVPVFRGADHSREHT